MKPSFLTDESGAVTVDWVVLTAALVGLGLAVMTVVRGGAQNVSTDISDTLSSDDIIQTAFASGAFSILEEGSIHHRHGQAWMEGTVAAWSDTDTVSDEQLAQIYTEAATFVAQQEAVGINNQQEYETRLDYLGAAEAAMANRGMDVPDAETDYTTALTNFRDA